MAETEDPLNARLKQFERQRLTDRAAPVDRGVERSSSFRTSQAIARTESLWRFVARRAAWEDAADSVANLKKLRTGAVAIYLDVEGLAGFEKAVGTHLRRTLQSELTVAGFRLLVIDALPPGSYGAILFVESKEPSNRREFTAKLRQSVAAAADVLWKDLKERFTKGIISIALGGVFIFVTPTGIHQIECSDASIGEVQRELSQAKTPDDLNRIVTKYCAPESTLEKILDAFDVKR